MYFSFPRPLGSDLMIEDQYYIDRQAEDCPFLAGGSKPFLKEPFNSGDKHDLRVDVLRSRFQTFRW